MVVLASENLEYVPKKLDISISLKSYMKMLKNNGITVSRSIEDNRKLYGWSLILESAADEHGVVEVESDLRKIFPEVMKYNYLEDIKKLRKMGIKSNKRDYDRFFRSYESDEEIEIKIQGIGFYFYKPKRSRSSLDSGNPID